MFGKFSLALATVALGTPAMAVEVSRHIDVTAPAAEVWAAVGPFCAISDWHPAIATCAEEEIDGARHRRLATPDGAEFLERYIEADGETEYGYAIVESPLPVTDYEARFEVRDMGDQSRIVWSSSFTADGVSDGEAADLLGGIYQAGLDALKARFAE